MPKRILIADDHESVLRRVRIMIESQPGWEVCGEAVNGRQAVTKAHELNPDLIVLDFAMPHLDGLRAASEIKQLLPDEATSTGRADCDVHDVWFWTDARS